jgi:hypothetical protein
MSQTYRKKILSLLGQRKPGLTICPSEVLEGIEKKDKEKMVHVRAAAFQLAGEGKIVITQKGKVVSPQQLHGPIRLRLK